MIRKTPPTGLTDQAGRFRRPCKDAILVASLRHRSAPSSAQVAQAMHAAYDQAHSQGRETPGSASTATDEAWMLRRWEGAETTRGNKAHWSKAHGQPLNADLYADLRTLQARAEYEASNNPIVEGMIQTHAVDLVGKDGPILEVVSESQEYNDALEDVFREWWELPDALEQQSGPELMRGWVHQWWKGGAHLGQLVTAQQPASDEISLRWLGLALHRLGTSPASSGDPQVAMGVRRDTLGRPIGYQIAEAVQYGPFEIWNTKYEEYPADEIIHQYEILEPGQVRGIPWLASALPTCGYLRDYDQSVMDAARNCASRGIVWYTEHPDSPFYEVNESTTFSPNTESTGPPGWKPTLIDPTQPAAQYVEFRTERMRELGRARAMPLMKILLGSERHNFSSARMDNENYKESLAAIAGWTERGTLNPLLRRIAREASLLRRNGKFRLPPRPAKVEYVWHWHQQPAVDPVKEGNAITIGLQNGTLPFRDACALSGRQEDRVIASRQRSAQKLEDAGLPPVPVFPQQPQDMPADEADGEAPADAKKTKPTATAAKPPKKKKGEPVTA
jgi:capsid protein